MEHHASCDSAFLTETAHRVQRYPELGLEEVIDVDRDRETIREARGEEVGGEAVNLRNGVGAVTRHAEFRSFGGVCSHTARAARAPTASGRVSQSCEGGREYLAS